MKKLLKFNNGMRKISLVLLLTIGSFFQSQAQYITLQDTFFRNWLKSAGFAGCITGNQLDTTCPAVLSATSLNIPSRGIHNFYGLQFFKNLQYLGSCYNYMDATAVLPPSLQALDLNENQSLTIPVLSNGLKRFSCWGGNCAFIPYVPNTLVSFSTYAVHLRQPSFPVWPNSLDTISCYATVRDSSGVYFPLTMPMLPSTMHYLNCNSLSLVALNLPDSLRYLNSGGNNVLSFPSLPPYLETLITAAGGGYQFPTSIPTLPATLKYFDCNCNTGLHSLPALPNSLTYLNCYSCTSLSTLPALPASLKVLNCGQIGLHSLPALPNGLISLGCSYNYYLTSLPRLPDSLQGLGCGSNKLDSLPPLPKGLTVLDCSANNLTWLPEMPDSVNYLDISYNNQLACLPQLKIVGYIDWTSDFLINCVPNYPKGIWAHDRNDTARADSALKIYFPTSMNGTPIAAFVPLCMPGNVHGCLAIDSCISQCVWPGDANYDGIVNNYDLLPIGLAYDSTGIVRMDTSITWSAHYCPNWADSLQDSINFKHIDCNGNGIINANDTTAILLNYSRTHARSGGMAEWRSGIPPLHIDIVPDTLSDGDTALAILSLGDSSNPASNVYGLAFTFNFDPLVVDTNYVRFSVDNTSWLTSPGDHIAISKSFLSSGKIDAAITRIDHTSRSGSGNIGTVAMRITTGNINGKNLLYYTMKCFISGLTVIDNAGNHLAFNEGLDSALVGYVPTGIRTIQGDGSMIKIFPNPVTDRLNLISQKTINQIRIVNSLGQTILADKEVNALQTTVPVANLSAGAYIIYVRTSSGEYRHSFIKIQ